jgi:hypothetical protein
MGLALYLSRVRSSDLLGRSRPKDEFVRFDIYFAPRKWRVWEKPWLNEDSRNQVFEVRIRRKYVERLTKEVGPPSLWRLALPRYFASWTGDLLDVATIPANLNEPATAIFRGVTPRELVERAFSQGDHAA